MNGVVGGDSKVESLDLFLWTKHNLEHNKVELDLVMPEKTRKMNAIWLHQIENWR